MTNVVVCVIINKTAVSCLRNTGRTILGGTTMRFGILKDIKEGENRVICTPAEVASIVAAGHQVFVQEGAGARCGFPDAAYAKNGATILATAKEMWDTCEFLAKVKEIGDKYGFCMHAWSDMYINNAFGAYGGPPDGWGNSTPYAQRRC